LSGSAGSGFHQGLGVLRPAEVLADAAAGLCGLVAAACAVQQLCGHRFGSSGSGAAGGAQQLLFGGRDAAAAAAHLPLHAGVACRLWLLATTWSQQQQK
jgi:hypothetical protein